MTTPVYMQGEAEHRTMAFVMPAKMKKEDLPLPSDTAVQVTKIEAGKFATFRFNGKRSDALERQTLQKLKDWLEKHSELKYDPQ